MQDNEEADSSSLSRRFRAAKVVLLLTVIGSALVGLFFSRDLYLEYQTQKLITEVYNQQRPGGGRLWGAPHAPPAAAPLEVRDLGRAQVFLLRHAEWKSTSRLQGLLYLAIGDWTAFAESSLPEPNKNAALLNNLGVSYLALAEKDPEYLFSAL